jgi:hypothetical protein
MHGAATFFDAWFNEKDQYPVLAKSGAGNTRKMPDKTTAKLAALHFYRLTWWTTTTYQSTSISAAHNERSGGISERNLRRSGDSFHSRTERGCHVR